MSRDNQPLKAYTLTPGDVGKFISTIFSDSRAALKTAIEQQMRANTAELAKKNTAEVPLLWQLVPGATSAPDAATSGPNLTASGTSGEFDAPNSGSGPISLRAGAAPARRNDRLAIFAGIGVIALGVLVVAATGAYRKDPVEPVVVAPTPPALPVNVSPQVVVSVKATPAQARIFVDDVPLPTNPATSTFVKDGASHRLRVEAPGFQRKLEFLTYDSNTLSVDITLEPEVSVAKAPPVAAGIPQKRGGGAAAAAATPHVEQPPVSSPPVSVPPEQPPVTGVKPPVKPSIDKADPWKN